VGLDADDVLEAAQVRCGAVADQALAAELWRTSKVSRPFT